MTELETRLRGGGWTLNTLLEARIEAATAIEFQQGMIEQADRQIAEYRQRAIAAEADNAAMRAENARLLQLVLSPGTIPFNWKELEAENAALLAILKRNQFALNGYCPECGGWNSNPNDPGRGDSPGFHTKNCEVAALLAGKKP